MEQCTDNRFEIIRKAKKDLLESTNIHTSEDEMEVLDNILFRCWQMDWLKMYEDNNHLKFEEILKENELLKRENRALADDNEMKCERYAEAKKALKRSCMKLSEVSQMPIDSEYHAILPIRSADEWEKEMMKGE